MHCANGNMCSAADFSLRDAIRHCYTPDTFDQSDIFNRIYSMSIFANIIAAHIIAAHIAPVAKRIARWMRVHAYRLAAVT